MTNDDPGTVFITPGQEWRSNYIHDVQLSDATDLSFSRSNNAYDDDGTDWGKFEGNPVLLLGTPDRWDDYSAFQPFVFHQDGYFHMVYNGSSKRSPTGYRWGCAWSKNGIHWTKSPDNPIFLPAEDGAWDGGKVSCPTLLRTGPDTFQIYYCGARTPSATYLGIGLVLGRLHKLASEEMRD